MIPPVVKKLIAAAKKLATKARRTGEKADHQAAMRAFDAAGKAAIKAGLDDLGDKQKGYAHDHWKATQKRPRR